jgi:formylglycine-generating enzyme required for sulfatase activity
VVTLSRPFWMMRTEVTVGAYKAYARALGAAMPPESDTNLGWAHTGHPIVNLSWNDASEFCRHAGGRLPSEAEWEYAARGGRAGARYVWGDEPTPLVGGRRYANVGDERAKRKVQCDSCGWFDGYDDGFVYTAPAGTFVANGFGLFDMAGNVWEWTADWYAERSYDNSAVQDPPGREYGQWRTLRGGSWSVNPVGLRTSYRFGFPPENRSDNFGARCVRDVAVP